MVSKYNAKTIAVILAGSAAVALPSAALADPTPECNVGPGVLSTECGVNSAAPGNFSTAVGALSRALAEESTAVGVDSLAAGVNSTALGSVSTANGNFSTAIGARALADAVNSTALGADARANSAGTVAADATGCRDGDVVARCHEVFCHTSAHCDRRSPRSLVSRRCATPS